MIFNLKQTDVISIISVFIIIFIILVFSFSNNRQGGLLCDSIIIDARNPKTGEIKEFKSLCDIPDGWDALETDREYFTRDGETWSRYRNDDLGIRFEYRINPDGYVLIEQNDEQWTDENAIKFVSLFDKREYAELVKSNIPREYPPSISVLILENPNNYLPREWAEKEKMISNLDFIVSGIEDIQFSGLPAIRYKIAGLYNNDIIVVLNNGLIYYLSGAYFDEDSVIRKDFIEMLQYFSLY